MKNLVEMNSELIYRYNRLMGIANFRDEILKARLKIFCFKRPSISDCLCVIDAFARAHTEFWEKAFSCYPELKGKSACVDGIYIQYSDPVNQGHVG